MRIASEGLSLAQREADSVNIFISKKDQVASAYFYVPLAIAGGIDAFTVEFDYAQAPDCILDLGVFDPRATAYPTQDGFRGWSGGARRHISISETAATPGYVPGPIFGGRWLIALGLHRIPEKGTAARLSVRPVDTEPLAHPVPETGPEKASRPGWYRGDCHCHTFHSDAKGSPRF